MLQRTVKHQFSLTNRQLADFSHVVIGGGVVGTAIAAELQKVPGNNVTLLEQHEMLGMETTSRNSEVIHAGLYYPKDSLKAKFCIRGKNLIYDKLDAALVPYKQCGKWVVAQNEKEQQYIEGLQKNADSLGVPVSLVSANQAKRQFPLIRAEAGALESPTTGIISAHDLTLFFQAEFENNDGTVAINTKVDDVEYEASIPQYRIACTEQGSGEQFEITSDNIVNSAGLFAQEVANMVLPKERHFKSYFAKGSYYAYAPETPLPTSKITSKLIYPCPNPNASSLGTHLTFDLGGQLRFGPDLEWVDCNSASELNYDVSANRIEEAAKSIATYFPSIAPDQLQPSYSGVRPKLLSQEENRQRFADYYIKEEDGFKGFVNLIGIESPGLTSSWAIAEHVASLYHP
ncbi:hypothetical protein ACI3L0_002337 [Candidozyma auris]|uniref:L-2-hydroxyglutarate dehydrogenase, mitochondrial n=1 Tax=Candidozyma auris TaxID=498019 RepID=A0A2H0ZIQ0_CANAR|nr:hypothetical protein B9J08_004341 [[Candida] auris]